MATKEENQDKFKELLENFDEAALSYGSAEEYTPLLYASKELDKAKLKYEEARQALTDFVFNFIQENSKE